MKITIGEKIIAYLTLLSGLAISAVAVYYSVAGLVSIFAAAVVPIMVMGVALETSKLVATVWLKQNWKIAPVAIRAYLSVAVLILMMITSIGIFGYLSKAHSDQAVPTGDVTDKLTLIDDKIKTQKDNIDAAKRALAQLDTVVDQTMARSTSEQGANRSANLRRSQAKERNDLQNEIASAQAAISKLNEERGPVSKQLRAVEAEVGPIRYIAAFIYGDNPDANILERSVRWVIILIVTIFDPLAVVLLLASQYSFQYFRQQRELLAAIKPEVVAPAVEPVAEQPESVKKWDEFFDERVRIDTSGNIDIGGFPAEVVEESTPEPVVEEKPAALTTEEIERALAVYAAEREALAVAIKSVEPEPLMQDAWTQDYRMHNEYANVNFYLDDFYGSEPEEPTPEQTEKEVRRKFKEENPNRTIHEFELKKELGLIDKLPWEEHVIDEAFVNDTVQVEAANDESDEVAQEEVSEQQDETERAPLAGYVQNAEQKPESMWQRIQRLKNKE